MKQEFSKISKLEGEMNFGGDKSISHRAVMFAGMSEGNSKITNLSTADDVWSTVACMRSLGAEIEEKGGELFVTGLGIEGLTKPQNALYAGNSGTTARLLSGILSGQKFSSTLTGDESLSQRPMKRIVEPLSMMGATFETSEKQTLPMSIHPAEKLKAIEYLLPVPSAQVKSAVLLAGLYGEEPTSVIESIPSRDHTERMLDLPVEEADGGLRISSSKKHFPLAKEYDIPGDISSGAFFIIPALLLPGSEIKINKALLNEGRTGFVEILQSMGAEFKFEDFKLLSNEFAGNIVVRQCDMKNIEIPEEKIPSIIDEIPILAIAGLFAEGDFNIRNAAELRVKETDRINAVCRNMELLGLDVQEFDDGFSISGNINKSEVTFQSFGDHRIAMAFGMLASILGNCSVDGFEAVSVSNPGFLSQLKSVSVL